MEEDFGAPRVTNPDFGSFFLADPERFPTVVEGDRWGEQERRLDLPGGPYLIGGLSASQTSIIDRELSSAVMSGQSRNAEMHQTTVLRAKPAVFRPFEIEGWEYTLDLESSAQDLRLAGMHFLALVPWEMPSGAGLWTIAEDQHFHGVIENYLRVLVSHRLLRTDGILLHSAGVVVDSSVYLFVGPSNVGKSTLARKALQAGVPVLSDDLNAVVTVSREPSVVQLPFTGELRCEATIRGEISLAGICLLEKGDTLKRESFSRGEAVAALLSTAPFVNQDAESFESLVATATALATRVPVARLTSSKETPFDEITRELRGFQ